jgi:hypothetical protein
MAIFDGAGFLDLRTVSRLRSLRALQYNGHRGALVGALSVAGAIFLILELSEPYRGLMRLSDEPLRNAMTKIDR